MTMFPLRSGVGRLQWNSNVEGARHRLCGALGQVVMGAVYIFPVDTRAAVFPYERFVAVGAGRARAGIGHCC